ncbi:MAG: hypothetical protein PVI90_11770 [Desulfobacteraceae bacterium]|jgi:hypothetical protein
MTNELSVTKVIGQNLPQYELIAKIKKNQPIQIHFNAKERIDIGITDRGGLEICHSGDQNIVLIPQLRNVIHIELEKKR